MTVARPIAMHNSRRTLRIGSVSFFNARPLIHGLENQPGLELSLDVPSRLLTDLAEHRFDVALLPIIDYQRMPGLKLVPSGGIGCDGPTLTVRVFSRVPIERVRSLACDTDSHTSVALARILFAESYGVNPEFVDWNVHEQDRPRTDAVLLIGDKVVLDEPKDYAHQIDLGGSWKAMTGLPFVFAAWVARNGVDLGDLPLRLERARHEGLLHVDEIVERHARPRGWPAAIARQYLTSFLRFDIGDRQLEAIRLFHALAARRGIIASPPRELEIYLG